MKNKKNLEEVSPFVFTPQLDPKKTFQNFIEGENNKLARTVGLSIAENPGQTTSNPYLVFGSPGCGKTHLINAIGISCAEKDPQKQVMYVSAREFQRQFTYSVRKHLMDDLISDVAYSPSGDTIAVAMGDKGIQMLDAKTGNILAPTTSPSFDPNVRNIKNIIVTFPYKSYIFFIIFKF